MLGHARRVACARRAPTGLDRHAPVSSRSSPGGSRLERRKGFLRSWSIQRRWPKESEDGASSTAENVRHTQVFESPGERLRRENDSRAQRRGTLHTAPDSRRGGSREPSTRRIPQRSCGAERDRTVDLLNAILVESEGNRGVRGGNRISDAAGRGEMSAVSRACEDKRLPWLARSRLPPCEGEEGA